MESDNTIIIAVYEKRIKSLEENRIVLDEKVSKCSSALPGYDEAFRTADFSLSFKVLDNPNYPKCERATEQPV